MTTFFGGPEPSDGLRMKKVSSISSTDCDMMIGGKASCDAGRDVDPFQVLEQYSWVSLRLRRLDLDLEL
jgi:hypothetical protein